MRTLYNVGRVVGYSAYEVYVKDHLGTVVDPDKNPPASEKEWLASSLFLGSSLLLKVPMDTSHNDDELWEIVYNLPNTSQGFEYPSRLFAANTILASFFHGEGNFEGDSPWANKVLSYGHLIDNTEESHPGAGHQYGENLPPATSDIQTAAQWTDDEKQQLLSYLKIVDGIVINSGEWIDSMDGNPKMDFSPGFNNDQDYTTVKIVVKGKITTSFNILLSGFTIRSVASGICGGDTSLETESPQDGDFLGPAVVPWANKIIFSVPSSYTSWFVSGAYRRQLPKTSQAQTVADHAIIDMKTTDPGTYYLINYQEAREPITVNEVNNIGDKTSVLTIFQRSQKYPPALWGSYIDDEGDNYLNPIDIVAPGSVKMFEDATAEELQEYEDTFPGTFGVNKNTEKGTIEVIGPDGTLVPAADVSLKNLTYTDLTSGAKKAQAVVTQTGKNKAMSLAVSDDLDGQQNTITANPAQSLEPKNDNIYWSALLEAFANDKAVDILGANMKAVKAGLPGNYIQFPNGLRLYISATEPPTTGVPIGSVGIGWSE